MKIQTMIAFLIVLLTACAPAQLTRADVQNTAIAVVGTNFFLTQTALPTATLVPPTFTPTATIVYPTTSPFPTQPSPPIFTPDAIQVERWKEYQTELAKALLSFDPLYPEGYDPEAYKDALCEWDILEQSGQDMYLWAICFSADGHALRMNPAVLYLKPDGSIRKVNVARAGIDRRSQLAIYNLDPFPKNVREKLCIYYLEINANPQCDYRKVKLDRLDVLLAHLEYRKSHADEPPLVVLSAMPAASPTP